MIKNFCSFFCLFFRSRSRSPGEVTHETWYKILNMYIFLYLRFYPHTSTDLVSPVCGTFNWHIIPMLTSPLCKIHLPANSSLGGLFCHSFSILVFIVKAWDNLKNSGGRSQLQILALGLFKKSQLQILALGLFKRSQLQLWALGCSRDHSYRYVL